MTLRPLNGPDGRRVGCFLTSLLLFSSIGSAQTQRLLGEVTEKDPSAKVLTLKSDSGSTAAVGYDDTTSLLRVPPGETSLVKAVKITIADVSVGDRVLVTGSAPAQRIIVMSRTDIAQKQASDRAEWQSRGVAGNVVLVDAAAKQITLRRRAGAGESTVVVSITDKTQFRRYAPDSVKFDAAKPSALSEIRKGDQVRVLGEQPVAEGKITAEVLVSGSFHNVAGTVASVDAAGSEIRVIDLETKKPLVVKVNVDSTMRRMPEMMARMFAARMNPSAAGPPSGQGRPAGPRGGGDMQSMLERMPPFNLSELKPGEPLMVMATTGSDPGRVTAIAVIAGVEPLLTAPSPQGDRRLSGPWNMGDINIMP